MRKERNNGMKSKKFVFITIGAVFAVFILCVFAVQSSRNRAISLEESVKAAESDIKVQEKRRVDLVYNLADCVKQYDNHESETLQSLADNMSKGNTVEDVNTAISAVAYSYPELKSNENYKQLMNELSITENMIAQHRENFNQSITKYNRYVKGFPARAFLSMTGYDVQNFERLDYQAPVDAPQNLFGD